MKLINAEIKNQSEEDAAAELTTYNFGAGGTAIGISYADARSSHVVDAGLMRASSDNTDDDESFLSINAIDSTEIRIGDTGKNASDEPTSGSISASIGAGVGGASVAIAEKNSKVKAWMGDDDGGSQSVIDGFSSQKINAQVEGQIRAKAFAAGAGLLGALQGVGTEARDYSSASTVLKGEIGAGDGSINASSYVVPNTLSRAYGVTIAAGGSAGVSVANAFVDTKSEVLVSDQTVFKDAAAVIINAQTGDSGDEDYVSADAQAFAASGAIFVGVGATQSRARNTAETIATIGDDVTLPADDFIVNARNYSRQISDADGYAVGALAVGYTESFATSKTSISLFSFKKRSASLPSFGL